MIKRIVNLLFYKKVKKVKEVKTGDEAYFDLLKQFHIDNPMKNASIVCVDDSNILGMDNIKKYEICNYIGGKWGRFYIVLFKNLEERLLFEIKNKNNVVSRCELKSYYNEALTFWFNNSNYNNV